MDLVTGAKRVVVAMQHAATESPRSSRTATRPDVTTTIDRSDRHGGEKFWGTLMETAPG